MSNDTDKDTTSGGAPSDGARMGASGAGEVNGPTGRGNDADPAEFPRAEPDDMLEDPEIELITDYLTRQLPPDQVDEVERRLDEDDAFRELAYPLILAWSVPPRWQREPMSHEELARHWDRFTKRVGFVHQKKAARRRWLRLVGLFFALFVFWLVAPLVVYEAERGVSPNDNASDGTRMASDRPKEPPRRAYRALTQFVPVTNSPDSGGWISIGLTRVKLDPGSRLLRGKAPIGNADLLMLVGSARFDHVPPAGTSPFADSAKLTVLTRAGIVLSTTADFLVSARTDTTDVEVLRRQRPELARAKAIDSLTHLPMPDHVVIRGTNGPIGVLMLSAGEIGRLQPGSKPVKLRAAADNPFNDNPLGNTLPKILP